MSASNRRLFYLDERPSPMENKDSLVIDAIKAGDLQAMEDLLARDPSLLHARVGEKGRSLLHLAARSGNWGIVDYLLSKGADINQPDMFSGSTPLHLLAIKGDVMAIQALIDRGARVNALDNSGNTPLHNAATFLLSPHVRLLIDHGSDINASNSTGHLPIHCALLAGSFPEAQILAEHGSLIDIHTASGMGDIDRIIKNLKNDHVNMDYQDADQRTPLHWASLCGQDKAATWLLDHGANIHARDKWGFTPLHLAAYWYASPNLLELLLHRGAALDAVTHSGATPLDLAMRRKNRAKAELLSRTEP